MYLANKVQNIQGSADVLLEQAGLSQEEIRADRRGDGARRAARRRGRGHRRDPRQVQADRRHARRDCIAAIEEYREAGCTHIMLELWGDDRERQIELFAEQGPPPRAAMTLAATPLSER